MIGINIRQVWSAHLALAADALDDLDEHCRPVRQRLAEDLQQDALQRQQAATLVRPDVNSASSG